MPDFAVSRPALHNVVGDLGAAIITRRIPGQEAGFIGDIRNVKSSWRTRFICFMVKELKCEFILT